MMLAFLAAKIMWGGLHPPHFFGGRQSVAAGRGELAGSRAA